MSHYGKTGSNEYSEKEVANIVILKLTIDEITGKQK